MGWRWRMPCWKYKYSLFNQSAREVELSVRDRTLAMVLELCIYILYIVNITLLYSNPVQNSSSIL